MEKTYQRITAAFPQKNLKRLTGSILLSLAFWLFMPLSAGAETLSLIADEETEELLADIVKPLFRAAHIPYHADNIHLVDDTSLNAFVGDGNHLFVFTGTILAADDSNELAGVLAHETGHIQGGHILRQKIKNQSMAEITLASALLAGTAAAVSGRGDAAMAVMLGTQSSALTHYTRYRTEEERSADEAAMKLLAATGQSPEGMLTFMKKISQQNTLNGIEESPYFRTHPITGERIGFFEENLRHISKLPPKGDEQKFLRVKAKLFAYLNPPAQTLRKYPKDNLSIPAGYARSIAYFKQLKTAQALAELDKLLAKEPDNPYFHEMKGQIYLETGKIDEAKREYRKALNLKPTAPLLQISLAQTILEGEPAEAEIREAIRLLHQSLISRPQGFAWLLLARAYGLAGKETEANYAAAEYSLYRGDTETAKRQALAAQRRHPDKQTSLKLSDLLLRIDSLEDKK